MNVLLLTLKNIRYRLFSAALTAVSVMVGFALVIVMIQVRLQTEDYFSESAYGYDLIVGAKGSPLQLVLNTVYHLDKPIENIPISFMEKLKINPGVEYVVPFSLGDNFRGFRIVGTDLNFFEKLEFREKGKHVEFAQGGPPGDKFDAVITSEVAEKTGLKVGDKFIAVHGLEEQIIKKEEGNHHDEDEEIEEEIGAEEHHHDPHEHNPYTVRGILKPTGTAIDRIILTNYLSVLTIHGLDDSDRKEITSMAVKMKSPMLAFSMRQAINKGKVAQAVLPFQEIEKLFNTIGRASRVLLIMGYLVIIMAGISIFLAIYNSLRERKRSLSILRALGAHRRYLFSVLFLEGFLICLLGGLAGFLIGHGLLLVLKNVFTTVAGVNISPYLFYMQELFATISIVVLGILVSLLPGIWAYRTEVGEALADG